MLLAPALEAPTRRLTRVLLNEVIVINCRVHKLVAISILDATARNRRVDGCKFGRPSRDGVDQD